MAFKGTATRTAQQIAEEIESVGGELNAATSLEMTSYFARVLKGDEGWRCEFSPTSCKTPVSTPESWSERKR